MAGPSDSERYFFAVWPDDAIRRRLDAWSAAIRTDTAARRIPAPNLHITVAFLGTLEAPQLRAVRAAAAQIRWSGAPLTLDRIGYWKRARTIWAGSREGCTGLSALAENLRGGLRRLGFRVDERAFTPHVTLYRNAARRPRWPREVIEWPIDELCLVRSRLSSSGARYEVVERWRAGDGGD